MTMRILIVASMTVLASVYLTVVAMLITIAVQNHY